MCTLPGGERSFDHPWEIRAFAMAVAAYHNGQYEWSEFQLSLIDSIKKWENDGGAEPWSYYEHWLEALETVLSSTGAPLGEVVEAANGTVSTRSPSAE